MQYIFRNGAIVEAPNGNHSFVVHYKGNKYPEAWFTNMLTGKTKGFVIGTPEANDCAEINNKLKKNEPVIMSCTPTFKFKFVNGKPLTNLHWQEMAKTESGQVWTATGATQTKTVSAPTTPAPAPATPAPAPVTPATPDPIPENEFLYGSEAANKNAAIAFGLTPEDVEMTATEPTPVTPTPTPTEDIKMTNKKKVKLEKYPDTLPATLTDILRNIKNFIKEFDVELDLRFFNDVNKVMHFYNPDKSKAVRAAINLVNAKYRAGAVDDIDGMEQKFSSPDWQALIERLYDINEDIWKARTINERLREETQINVSDDIRDYWDMLNMDNTNHTLCLIGPTGTGKTVQAVELLKRAGKPFIVLAGNAGLDPDSMVRVAEINNGQLEFRDAPFVKAVEAKYNILLDEINIFNNPVIESLHGILDGSKEYVTIGSREIQVTKEFKVICTMNGSLPKSPRTEVHPLASRMLCLEVKLTPKDMTGFILGSRFYEDYQEC